MNLVKHLQQLFHDALKGLVADADPFASLARASQSTRHGDYQATCAASGRVLRFLGHKVIGDNHLGDWGSQMGMILWGWKNHRNEAAYNDSQVNELARLYRLTAGKIKPYEKLSDIRALEAKGKKAKA